MTKQEHIEKLISEYFEYLKHAGPIMEEDAYKGMKVMEKYFTNLYNEIYTKGHADGRKASVNKQSN